MDQTELHVVAACDDLFAMPLAAAAASVLSHSGAPGALRFTVIDCGVSSRNRLRVRRSIERSGAALSMPRFASDVPRQALRGGLIPSKATFARLYAAEYVAAAGKALYLDADTVVTTDVAELFDLLPPGALVAGVADSSETERAGRTSDLADLRPYLEEPTRDSPYINAGVLLLDLEAWRRERIAERARALLAEHAFARGDQDVINIVCAGRIETLPLEYNVQTHVLEGLEEEARRRRFRSAKVIHYTQRPKPWHLGCDPEIATPWLEAVDRTAWKGWRPTPRRLLAPKLRRGWRMARTQPSQLVSGLVARVRA